MAEEYCGAGANWWETTLTTTTTNQRPISSRFDGGSSSTSSTTTTLATSTGGGFGWLTEASDMNNTTAGARCSSLDSMPPSGVAATSSSYQDTKMDASSLLVGLGLSSQPIDWNHQHSLLRNTENKGDNTLRSMVVGEGGMGGRMLNSQQQQQQQQIQWREKVFNMTLANEVSSEFNKQIGAGRGISLDQSQFSPSCSSMDSTITNFQLDSPSSSSVYGNNNNNNHTTPGSNMLPHGGGFIGSSDHRQQQQQQQMPSNFQQNYFYPSSQFLNKVPQFLKPSSPNKHIQQQQQQQQQFANNAAYWNAASGAAVSMPDVRPNLFSSLQNQLPMSTFEEKPKGATEVRDSSLTGKKSGAESNNKRGRNEGASSTLPPFKVRKEKMGDRITALQQLVSPFGKTDTASVLSEAIEYIKFLHEQVSVLSTPYLKSGASYQQQPQQGNEKTKIDPDGAKQDLRSRGLCLVPVSSTFPVTHETTVDFWTPTFGGTFR